MSLLTIEAIREVAARPAPPPVKDALESALAHIDFLTQNFAQCLAREREECAKIAEDYAVRAASERSFMLLGPAHWTRQIATDIRGRTPSPASKED